MENLPGKNISFKKELRNRSITDRPKRNRLPVKRFQYSFSHLPSRSKSTINEVNHNQESQQLYKHKLQHQFGYRTQENTPFNLTFESVKGLKEQINRLKEMIMFPLLYPELFERFELTQQRGILLYGPPGTGKTLLPRVVATELTRRGIKVSFFYRKGADCLSKWAGESERELKHLFHNAYAARPSIIFFDEVDALAPIRSSRQDQIYCSIVSTLLALMDGIDDYKQVYVIGATNRLEAIDPALRRPGRFDKELKFELPSRTTRKEIIQLHVQKWRPSLDEEILNRLADKTIGYSGADLKALCGDAALNALKRTFPQVYESKGKIEIDHDRIEVLEKDFESVMKVITPSTFRIKEQSRVALPPHIRPLLYSELKSICENLSGIFPFESFRPRLIICAQNSLFGQTSYLSPAILYHLESVPVHTLEIPCLFSNVGVSMEEAGLLTLRESMRNLPSVIYIPHICKLWGAMSLSLRDIFLSFVRDIPPKAPLLILATSDEPFTDLSQELQDIFSEKRKEVVTLENPTEESRLEFFNPIFSLISQLRMTSSFRSKSLERLKSNLVQFTEGLPTEELERTYVKFLKVLDSYKFVDNRASLYKDLLRLVDELRGN